MNRRALLQGLLGGAALAAAPSTALALPRETQIAATSPAIARVYCRFGWTTRAQQELAEALRRWEAELGRPVTWDDARVDDCSNDGSPKSQFHRKSYRVAIECSAAIRSIMEARGWSMIRCCGDPDQVVLHPPMMPWDHFKQVHGSSFAYEEHWLHPAHAGTVQDILIPLYGVAGMASARVSLGRMGWSEGEF